MQDRGCIGSGTPGNGGGEAAPSCVTARGIPQSPHAAEGEAGTARAPVSPAGAACRLPRNFSRSSESEPVSPGPAPAAAQRALRQADPGLVLSRRRGCRRSAERFTRCPFRENSQRRQGRNVSFAVATRRVASAPTACHTGRAESEARPPKPLSDS